MRFRGGLVAKRNVRAIADLDAERTDGTRGNPRRPQNPAHQRGCGGFPISSGEADRRQLARWMAVERG